MNCRTKNKVINFLAELVVIFAMLSSLALLAVVAGCTTPLEQVARNGIAASNGILTTAQAQYLDECTKSPEESYCQIISKAVGAHNVSVDALNLYCASDAYTNHNGPCEPNKNYVIKLKAALQDLDVYVTDVKQILKK